MRSLAFQLSLLVALLLTSGCGEKNEDAKETTPPQSPALANTASASPAKAAIEEDDFGGWEVEAFSAAAEGQLESLKAVLMGKIEEEADLSAALSHGLSNFQSDTVQDDPSFNVKRAKVTRGEEVALPVALTQLRTQFPSGAPTLVEVKIVRVSLNEDTAQAELQIHLADGQLQVNAIWESEWTTKEVPVLTGLAVRSHEECLRKGNGTLADCTGAVLGRLPEIEQVARGMDHWMARIETTLGLEMGSWHGIAAADVNGDGLDDLYLSDGGGLLNRLLVQQADGSVRDQSRESGLGFLDHSFGTLFADFDNDGDQDAAIAMASGVLILENDGGGKFTVREGKSFPAAIPYSLCAADYDQDGDLDLYVCCYLPRSRAPRHSLVARPMPYHDATNGGRNELLRNEGQLRFRNVTKAAGLTAANHKYSYSGSWDDYDGDGDLDLYVANDFGGNHLYQNQLKESGQPVFRDVAESAGVRDVAAGMSTCWGDYDNDGQVDLYVGNMFSSAGNRIAFQDRFREGRAEATRALYRRHARGNSLFRNRGDGRFEDVSVSSGTTMGRWAWSSLFADINNDGWEDLLVSNGFITQEDTDDL